MSVSTCAFSGLPLENPVVSVKSGHVFERDLIKKHVDQTGQCPITGIDLNWDTDFVDLKVSKVAIPKPVVANNIPGILQMFQGEWDSIMLEVFQLRKNLEQTRKELSQALYQHDAACRVICRLLREKEDVQGMLSMTHEKLEEYKSSLASQVDQGAKGYFREDKENEGIYKELVSRMEQLSEKLSEQRKKQKAPRAYPKNEDFKRFKELNKFPAHESTKPGILDLDIHPINEQFVISGGRDSNIVLLDTKAGQIVKKLKPFKSRKNPAITVTKFLPGQNDLFALIGSSEGTAGVWSLDHVNDSYQEKYSIKGHSAAITGAAFQPLNEYAVISSKDKTWSFHNLTQGVKLHTFKEDKEINAVEFHPDGLMLIVGFKDGALKIYDIRSQQVISEISDFKGEIGNISFSNKGLYFAASWKQSEICRVFNLRKLGQEVNEVHHLQGNVVNSVNFDFYGGHLLTGAGNSLNIFAAKQWDEPLFTEQNAHEGIVNVAKFAPSGTFMVSGADDRFMKVYGL